MDNIQFIQFFSLFFLFSADLKVCNCTAFSSKSFSSSCPQPHWHWVTESRLCGIMVEGKRVWFIFCLTTVSSLFLLGVSYLRLSSQHPPPRWSLLSLLLVRVAHSTAPGAWPALCVGWAISIAWLSSAPAALRPSLPVPCIMAFYPQLSLFTLERDCGKIFRVLPCPNTWAFGVGHLTQ